MKKIIYQDKNVIVFKDRIHIIGEVKEGGLEKIIKKYEVKLNGEWSPIYVEKGGTLRIEDEEELNRIVELLRKN